MELVDKVIRTKRTYYSVRLELEKQKHHEQSLVIHQHKQYSSITAQCRVCNAWLIVNTKEL